MNSFFRVFPYIWPYRRRVLLSFFFALMVAVLWSLILGTTYPVMKVLVKGQSLSEYVEEEIADLSADIEKKKLAIQEFDRRLQELETSQLSESNYQKIELLKDQARQQSKLNWPSKKLLWMNRLKADVVPLFPKDQFDLLALILGIILAATILKGICVWTQEVLVGSTVELTTMSLRKACFRHILKLDYQTAAMSGSSDIMSRFTYDMNLLSTGLTLVGGKIVREPLKALCCIVGAFLVCWQLTLLSLLIVPIVGIFFYRIGKLLKKASHRLMESMSRIYKTLDETFESLKIVIAFNGGNRHRLQFHRDNKEYLSKAIKILKIDALTSPTTESLGILAAFVALLPSAYLVLRETRQIWEITLTSTQMEFDDLALLYALLAGVIDPVRKLSSTYAKVKRSAAAADRVFELMDSKTLVKETNDPQPMPVRPKSIAFQNIAFSYAANAEDGSARGPVLDEVNLTVHADEVIVVVGENGSGKSTLVNLLPRYFDPSHGAVTIDRIDIRDFSLRDLRSRIGVVTQETLLFDESISENIRYGKPEATPEEIEQAARQAHVLQFVDQLPDGFETPVGEKGQRLSGGQRQRIALARAMIRNPAVLILDEATSAIDAQSERLIHEALRNFTKGRITFLITHSVSQSILDFVTRVVVMDQGRLIASGPHEELIRSCPVYQRLYQAQIQKISVENEQQQQQSARAAETSEPQGSTDSLTHVGPPHIIPLHPEIGRQTDRRSVFLFQATDSPETTEFFGEEPDEEPGHNPSGVA